MLRSELFYDRALGVGHGLVCPTAVRQEFCLNGAHDMILLVLSAESSPSPPTANRAARGLASPAEASAPRLSIVVLPFLNLRVGPQLDAFSGALATIFASSSFPFRLTHP
jgi:hypothetical protein